MDEVCWDLDQCPWKAYVLDLTVILPAGDGA